jgi:ATP-binding cassette subfamily G (WHITE) protein 2
MFSANVRLTGSQTMNERIELVNQIIVNLGLEKCADSRIGTHFIRGVSGGEKRRACIGMELVLSPKILFLDEPTSGKWQISKSGHFIMARLTRSAPNNVFYLF